MEYVRGGAARGVFNPAKAGTHPTLIRRWIPAFARTTEGLDSGLRRNDEFVAEAAGTHPVSRSF